MVNGYILNPDEEFVSNLRKRIKDNGKYCPCKLEKIKENKCPCADFREGRGCHCGLYIKDPNNNSEKE